MGRILSKPSQEKRATFDANDWPAFAVRQMRISTEDAHATELDLDDNEHDTSLAACGCHGSIISGEPRPFRPDYQPQNRIQISRATVQTNCNAAEAFEFNYANANAALSHAIGDSELKQNFLLSLKTQIVTKTSKFLRVPGNLSENLSDEIMREGRQLVKYGGHSWVYKVQRKRTGADGDGQAVCLKLLVSEVTPHGFKVEKYRTLERHFAREMKTWGGLRHENVAHLCGYIVEEVEGNVVTAGFVSPWCQNGSITTYLRLSPQADRFTLVRDVAYGLQYLHDHEPPIVHGDIKPDNILIGDDGRALITDFGLSETTDSFTTGQMSTNFAISGTVKYMAPELVGYYERKPIRTLESDIWAYGCTSIQILTDKLPYACKDNLQVFHLLLRGQPPFHWDLDVKHEHIFSRCCSQTPSDRPTISRIVGELEFLAPSNIVANNARICS